MEQWRKKKNITHSDSSRRAQWHKGNKNKETRKGIKCLENKNKNFIEFIYFVRATQTFVGPTSQGHD